MTTRLGSEQVKGECVAAKQAQPKKRLSLFGAIAIIVIGLALIAYPFVSDWLAKQQQLNVVQSYEQTVQETAKDDLSAEIAKAKDYNRRLLNSRTRVIDPFDAENAAPTTIDYESVLNIGGDSVMGTLNIPKISVCLPIYHGTTDEVLEKGVGHLIGTSVPIGGKSTHSVLSAHTGLPSAKFFDDLDKLGKDDWFVISVLGEDHAYRIYKTEVVLPEQTESLVVQADKDLVTLVTCTPYGVNTHRLLQHAKRCKVPQEWLDRNLTPSPALPPAMAELPLWAWTLIGLAIGAVLFAVIYRLSKRRKQ